MEASEHSGQLVGGALQNVVQHPIFWLSGWYASRLHAVREVTAQGMSPQRSICGAWVYDFPPTRWARKKVDAGVPHCRHCEALVNGALHRQPESQEDSDANV